MHLAGNLNVPFRYTGQGDGHSNVGLATVGTVILVKALYWLNVYLDDIVDRSLRPWITFGPLP